MAAGLASTRREVHLEAMFIQTETTPNPEVLKFLPGREVLGEGAREFRTPEEGEGNSIQEVWLLNLHL